MASGTLVTKDRFDAFVLPYLQRFVKVCKEYKPCKITLHICGETSNILDSMAACGFDTISLDNLIDIEEAKSRVGDKVHLLGNVDPVNIIYNGTTEDVKKGVKDCYKKGWDSKKGYTIGTGCDTPMYTPLENSLAFMEEARKCAKYPVSPENFE